MCNCGLYAQKVQTIVPGQPVVIGTAFQVQYIIIDPKPIQGTTVPAFQDFTLVSGPNHYKGRSIVDGRMQEIENITFTLVPLKLGSLSIPGLQVSFSSGERLSSLESSIKVVPKPKMSFASKSSFTDAALYAPSSQADLDKLIDENLFIRTEVSSKDCYVGEAITASFKLYSRLQSSSELVRVPSLYGFSVIDILDIREAHQAVETINGKIYNTSILRKVQLYPEQSGELVIDEMVVKNMIEFDDSLDNDKKTMVHKELRSKPISVKVKAVPAKRPLNFNGAVGMFGIETRIDESQLEVNEQGKFSVTVRGKGNFIQMSEPLVKWPVGLEVFDPVVEDKLNSSLVPSQGTRTYTYGIVADSAGHYIIPAVEFSFFDPEKDSFRKVSTQPLKLEIIPAPVTPDIKKKAGTKTIPGYYWLVAALAVVFISVAGWFFLRKKKTKAVEVIPVEQKPLPVYSRLEMLDLAKYNDKQVCIEVTRLLNELLSVSKNIPSTELGLIDKIKEDCQLMAYSNVDVTGTRESIKQRAIEIATRLES